MDGTSPDKNTPLLTLNQSHVIATVETLSQVSNMNTEPVIKQFFTTVKAAYIIKNVSSWSQLLKNNLNSNILQLSPP